MTDKPTPESIQHAARRRGIPLGEAEAKAIAPGAEWLKQCVEQLKAAGYDK